MPREVYELLARAPKPEARRAPAFNHHLPDDIRARIRDDDDARTAAVAADEWDPAPVSRVSELLSRATPIGRELLLLRLDGLLPAGAARGMLADIAPSADPEDGVGLRRRIAAIADLTARFLAAPQLRAAVAANPTLDVEHVTALAHDPDNQVRAAVVARRGLDPVLRESTSVEYDDHSSGNTVEWLLTEDLSEPDRLAFARSRHQVLRKTLAMRTDLSDETVGILAADESFAVRLFVCERQPNAPGWLLARIAADGKDHSRWDMLAHKNFPDAAATALARSDDSQDREVAAAHPGLPIETIEALLADDTDRVRRRAEINPSIPTDRPITLLEADEPAVVCGAATNRMLPVATMHQILEQARL
ncbi:hypothetical protein ACFW2Y_28035 [Streptomyces sp. NPDC058877]|uniref:hypothetical protein n=1 Tax=unclassified Streptomyces TaxID=2593676 RepID=UPI0036BE9516